jgi:formylglycine-generating enzyme required for sulfatase activity
MVAVKGWTFETGGRASSIPADTPLVRPGSVSDFSICEYPVTHTDWCMVFDHMPATGGDGETPVTMVSWYEATEYCNRLSIARGLKPCYETDVEQVSFDPMADGYRLPTEAEWEFAARGGRNSRGTQYAGGDELSEVGWFNGNSGGQLQPVSRKRPNELGIYDMSGNVWEWCWDIYDPSTATRSGNRVRSAETGDSRVYRGGS